MNCPQCNEMIGQDQWHAGPWEPETDEFNRVVGCTRVLVICCECCGLFRVVEDDARRIRSRVGPYTNPADVARLSRLVPALRHDRLIRRRVPA